MFCLRGGGNCLSCAADNEVGQRARTVRSFKFDVNSRELDVSSSDVVLVCSVFKPRPLCELFLNR